METETTKAVAPLSDEEIAELIAWAEEKGSGHLLVGRGRHVQLLKEIQRLRAIVAYSAAKETNHER